MRGRTIRLLISAALAVPLMLWWLHLARQPSDGPTILTNSIVPFYLFGALFSGNYHAPSEVTSYLSMYVFAFILVYAVLAILAKIRAVVGRR